MITSALPQDKETLLVLAPEELALILLKIAHQAPKPLGNFLPENITNSFPNPSNNQEIKTAFNEAWHWLFIHALIIPDSGIGGNNGWMLISRLGAKVANEHDFKYFQAAAAFPKTLLHPSIADKVWLSLARGDLDEAVFAAFKAVEESVRTAGGFGPNDIGVDLMRRAFKIKTGPLTNPNQPEGEQDALSHLFAGAIGSYKNPHSHRTVSITDPREAQEMVMLASHLLRIVESRKPA